MQKINVRLPDGRIIRNVPKGTTKEQLQQKLDGSTKPASSVNAEIEAKAPSAPQENDVESSFGSQFSAGVKDIGNLAGNALPAVVGRLAGFDDYSDKQLQDYLTKSQEIQKQHPREVESFTDVEDVGSALTYAKETIARGLPSLIPSVLTGGVGALAAKEGIKIATKKAVSTQAAQLAAKRGATVGTLAGAASQTIPSEYVGKISEGIDPDTAARVALVAGSLQAGLEAIVPGKILGKFLPKNADELVIEAVNESVLKRVGKEAVSSSWKEGLTESTQEVISQIASQTVNPDAEFNLEAIIENGLAGVLVGGTAGGASGLKTQGKQETAINGDFAKVESELTENITPPTEVEQVETETTPVETEPNTVFEESQEKPLAETESEAVSETLDIQDTTETPVTPEKQAKEPSVQSVTSVPEYKGEAFTGYDISPEKTEIAYTAAKKALETTPVLQEVISSLGNLETKSKNTLAKNITRKAQIVNSIDTIQNYNKDVLPRSLGETFRLLSKSPILTKKDRNAILGKNEITGDKRVNELAQFISDEKTYGVGEWRDIAKAGKSAVQAEAFSVFVQNKRDGESNADLPKETAEAFDKIDNYLQGETTKIPEGFDLQGFIPIESTNPTEVGGQFDLFSEPTDVYKDAPVLNLNDFIDNTIISRGLKTKGRLHENINRDKNLPKEDSTVFGSQVLGSIPNVFRFTQNVAAKSPLFARVKQAADSRANINRQIAEESAKLSKGFFNAPASKRKFTGDLLAQLRRANTKADITPEGIVYKLGSETKLITDPETIESFKSLRSLFDYYKDLDLKVNKAKMLPIFAATGLGFNPTQAQFEVFKKRIETKEIPKKYTPSPAQLNALNEYFDYVKTFQQNTKKSDYIPFSRFGNKGLVAVVKGPDGNNTEFFTSYETSKTGKVDEEAKATAYSELKAWAEKEGLAEGDYKVNDFNLTHNNIRNLLPKSAGTLELINQILTDRDYTAYGDYVTDVDKETTVNYKKDSEAEIAAKFLVKQPFKLHNAKASEVAGESQDWDRVITSYISGGSYYAADALYSPKIQAANARLQTKAESEYLKEYAQNYTESISNPYDRLQTLRTVQYISAFAGNISSGLLQLQSMATTMPMYLTFANGGSTLKAFASIKRATKKVHLFSRVPDSARDALNSGLLDFGNKELHAKFIKEGKITPEESQLILKLHNIGVLRPAQTLEFLDDGLSGSAKWKKKLQVAGRFSGIFMSSTEEYTRAVQALASLDTLKKPANQQRLHNNLYKNDEQYKASVDNSALSGPQTVPLTQYLVERALGQYGKEGRAPIQNTAAAVTIYPFATYPFQMISNIADLVKNKGPEGKRAAANGLLMMFIVGGAFSLPGADDMKKIVEALLSKIMEEDVVIETMLNEMLSDFGPLPTVLNEGMLNSILGVEVASRFKLSTPATPVIDFFRGEFRAEDIAGVHGNLIKYPGQIYQNLQEGMPLHHALLGGIPVSGVSNAYKGLFLYPDEGKSYRGQASISLDPNAPEYANNISNKIKRSIGLKPLSQHRKEQAIDRDVHWQKQFTKHTPKYVARMERNYLKFLKAKTESAKEKHLQSFIKSQGDLIEYYISKNIPNVRTKVKNAARRSQENALLKMRVDLQPLADKRLNLNTRQKKLDYNGK